MQEWPPLPRITLRQQKVGRSRRSRPHDAGMALRASLSFQPPPCCSPCCARAQDTDFLVQLLTDNQFLARTDIKPGSSTQARLLSNIQVRPATASSSWSGREV